MVRPIENASEVSNDAELSLADAREEAIRCGRLNSEAPYDPTDFQEDAEEDPKLHCDFIGGSIKTSGALMDDRMGVTYPRHRVPAFARPGMCISLYNCDVNHGVILQVTEEFCIARSADGKTYALAWGEVEITDCRPDPAHLPQQQHADEAVKCFVRPGMRVAISVGDGGDERPGTVIAALPECCVVKLDAQLAYGGMTAAADWDLVTVLNLAPGHARAR